MAQSITFVFADDADAQKVLDEFCIGQRYAREAMEGESKKAFLRRKTLQWWFDNASQGKAKAEINNWRAEYEAMVVTE